MSQRKAKALRKQAYGDLSHRSRHYVWDKVHKRSFRGKEYTVGEGTVRNAPGSLRADYQQIKKSRR